jgi:Ca2+-binding RTX toxin-like protein
MWVSVASDALDGGTGDDYLIGDSNLMLVGSATTTGNLPAGLEQAADDFDNGVEGFAKTVKGKPTPLGFTTSNDTLHGAEGNDVVDRRLERRDRARRGRADRQHNERVAVEGQAAELDCDRCAGHARWRCRQ